MKISRSARLARWSAFAVLGLGVFEACSNSGDSTPLIPTGPPSIDIVTPAATLACDNTLVVQLTLSNFKPKAPYTCGTQPQCGSVLVTLRETADGPPLLSQRAATSDVQLDLTDLVTPKTADAPTLAQVHIIQADLYGDSLKPFVVGPDGVGSRQISVTLAPATDCAGEAGASAGGAAGAPSSAAGAAGAPVGQAGTGGTGNGGGGGGAGGISGSGGSGGLSSGGVAAGAGGDAQG